MSKVPIVLAAVAFIATSLLAIGATALVAPEKAASMFGVPYASTQTRAYVWAAGTRDIAIGGLLLGLVILRVGRQVLGASLIVAALIPVGDVLIVYINTGTQNKAALVLHSLGIVSFLALGPFEPTQR